MSHWLGPTLLTPPLSMVWQVKHCCLNSASPCWTLASLSLGPIGGSSAGFAAQAATGAASATAIAGFSSGCTLTSAFDTLPTTIANSAEARKQPAMVLQLAIVGSRPGVSLFPDVAVARPNRAQ